VPCSAHSLHYDNAHTKVLTIWTCPTLSPPLPSDRSSGFTSNKSKDKKCRCVMLTLWSLTVSSINLVSEATENTSMSRMRDLSVRHRCEDINGITLMWGELSARKPLLMPVFVSLPTRKISVLLDSSCTILHRHLIQILRLYSLDFRLFCWVVSWLLS